MFFYCVGALRTVIADQTIVTVGLYRACVYITELTQEIHQQSHN